MNVVPSKALDRVQFYENHIAPFTASAVAIGTSAAAVTDLTTKTTAARDAYTAKQAAETVAKNATTAWHNAVNAMTIAGASILKQIRAKAEISGPSIYELASIPAPATPAPVGPPGTPYKFLVVIRPDGSLQLKWKCDNPAGSVGTIYQVYRSIDGQTQQYIGGSGTREYIDSTVPTGTSEIVYSIQALRSTAVGVANNLTVKFGTNESGGMTMTVTEAKKLAA